MLNKLEPCLPKNIFASLLKVTDVTQRGKENVFLENFVAHSKINKLKHISERGT